MLPTSVDSSKKARDFQKNIYFCLIDYVKTFDYVDQNKLWKILKEVGRADHLTCLLRNLYAGQDVTLRTGHRKQTGSKSGEEYIKVVYCYSIYLTYMQKTSCKILGWLKHKLESRLPGEISITSHMQTALSLRKKLRTKEPLDESERGE